MWGVLWNSHALSGHTTLPSPPHAYQPSELCKALWTSSTDSHPLPPTPDLRIFMEPSLYEWMIKSSAIDDWINPQSLSLPWRWGVGWAGYWKFQPCHHMVGSPGNQPPSCGNLRTSDVVVSMVIVSLLFLIFKFCIFFLVSLASGLPILLTLLKNQILTLLILSIVLFFILLISVFVLIVFLIIS